MGDSGFGQSFLLARGHNGFRDSVLLVGGTVVGTWATGRSPSRAEAGFRWLVRRRRRRLPDELADERVVAVGKLVPAFIPVESR